MFTLRETLKPILALSILTLSIPAIAARGGNGPGNGTDELAAEIAFKKLMDTRDGLSVEEKIYDLWVKAENSLPDIQNDTTMGVWFGLSVVNLGEPPCWPGLNNGCDYGHEEKFQKGFLTLKALQSLKMGNIEIKPRQVFGMFRHTGNFDGDMDPHSTYMGLVGGGGLVRRSNDIARWDECRLDGRSEAGGIDSCTLQPLQTQASGLSVHNPIFKNPRQFSYHPLEYRQVDSRTLVGVRMAKTDGSKPCPDSKAITRKETKEEEVTRYFLGVPYKSVERREVDVVDHWENAADYGVPGVCDVHYLVKYDGGR